MDIPIIHDTNRYEFIKDISAGDFSVTRLMKDKQMDELVAIKYIERGAATVFLTPSHLGIVMEYASGGSLYDLKSKQRRFNESKARYFFQQLISGVIYCHSMGVCHGDLKLENILLDGSEMPRLKICNFGYSKSSALDSKPNSRVGTTTPYMAPEVTTEKEYDGKTADVWSCGMALYVMLVGDYPFDVSHRVPINFDYSFPDDVAMSLGCGVIICSILLSTMTAEEKSSMCHRDSL